MEWESHHWETLWCPSTNGCTTCLGYGILWSACGGRVAHAKIDACYVKDACGSRGFQKDLRRLCECPGGTSWRNAYCVLHTFTKIHINIVRTIVISVESCDVTGCICKSHVWCHNAHLHNDLWPRRWSRGKWSVKMSPNCTENVQRCSFLCPMNRWSSQVFYEWMLVYTHTQKIYIYIYIICWYWYVRVLMS